MGKKENSTGRHPKEVRFIQPRDRLWVDARLVTLADINAILRFYQEITGRDVAQIDEEVFTAKMQQLMSFRGLVEQKIVGRAVLEWRQPIKPVPFVRFKIWDMPGRENMLAQERIDRYFDEERKIAHTLREISQTPPSLR